MKADQLEETISDIVLLAQTLPKLRLTNKEMERPEWTDRTGDYEKNLHLLLELTTQLQEDYAGRIGNDALMKALFNQFGVDLK